MSFAGSFLNINVKTYAHIVLFQNTSCFRVRLDVSHRGGFVKTVTRKQMAYGKPSKVRYPVGTRVIALFRNMEGIGKNAYYAGIVAEPLKILNGFRFANTYIKIIITRLEFFVFKASVSILQLVTGII